MGNGVQEFLDTVGRVLSERKSPVVFCIIHSEMGLELLPTTNDLVVVLGMLAAARLKVADMYGEHLEVNREMVRERERATMAALAVKPGMAN